MVSFRANLISKHYISQKGDNDYYTKEPVSFVRLDAGNKEEVMTIRETAANWQYGDEYAGSIADCMLEDLYYKPENNDQFFAITKQNANLNKLRPNDILALALTSTSSSGEECIDYAQIEPKYVATLPEYILGGKLAQYKAIGTALFDGIEQLFKEKALCVFSLENTLKYYKKRGYEQLTKGPVYKMILKR